MEIKNSFILLIAVFFISCSSNKKSTPVGHVFLSYKSGKQMIASLPFHIKTLDLISEDDNTKRISLGDKTLDMAIHNEQFIKAVTIPSGQYTHIRWHISLNNSELKQYSQTDQNWISAQMIDSEHRFIPQERDSFIYQVELAEPLVIIENNNYFLQIDMHPEQTLSLANMNKRQAYWLFDPQLTIKSVEKTPISGELVSFIGSQVTINVSGIFLTATVKEWMRQGNPVETKYNSSDFINRKVQLLAEKDITKNGKINADINIIDGIFYQGFIARDTDKQSLIFKGHQFDHKKGVIYQPKISIFSQSDVLFPGQRLNFYTSEPAVFQNANMNLLTSKVHVRHSTTTNQFKIMRINGFSPLPFYSDSLNISADIEPPDAESDVIELQGFFLGLTGQEFISSLVKSIHSQEVMLKMNFHLFNEAMLLYESNSDDITRLFFLKSLDRVSSEITTLDGVIPLQKSVKEIHLTTSSQLSLVIQNNNSSYRYYYSTVKEFLEELKNHLLDKKIFRLISKGKLINMDLITNELIVVLQQNKHNDHDLSIEKDSVIDMAIINDASRFYIERDKDWINGIIANKSTTEPTINKNSSSDNQNNILKGNHTEIDEKMAKILKLPIEDYLALRAAQHFNKYVIETDASLNQFSDPKEILNDWRSYKRIDSGFDNKLKYSRGYATNPSGKEINTTLLYGNHGTENSDLFLLTHNEFFSDFFKANNSDQLEYDHTYISFQNGHAFFDLTDNKLLPIQLDRTKNKFIVNEADFEKTFISEDKHDDTLYKIEAFKRSKTLPIFEITIYDQDEKISRSKTNTKLFILGSTLSSIKPMLNNFIETSSGDNRHSLYYGVLDGALLNFVSDNDTLNGAPVIKRLRIKSPNPIIYRTDQLVTHQIGEGEDAEIFTYISDKAIMKNIQSFKTNSSSKYDNNDIYQGPSDLKIIFQLENDPTINESVYKNFSRYPDKTIIVQINNNGDYDIVNGIDNLKEFTRDNSKSNIIFDIQGHGDRFFEGRKTPTTLARIIKNFVDTAPDFMAKKYNDNSNNTPISGSDIFLAPSHFNMSGCSLGAQSEYLLDSLTESLSINYAALAGKDGDMTFQNVSDHKKGLIFWGGSFSEKFIYAYNDIGGKLPKTIEAWSKDTTRDATGELGVYAEFSTKDDLEDAKLYHKVFTIEDGLPKQLDNIEYRRNPTTQFIEYRLESNKPFIKIFRGPDFNSSRITN